MNVTNRVLSVFFSLLLPVLANAQWKPEVRSVFGDDPAVGAEYYVDKSGKIIGATYFGVKENPDVSEKDAIERLDWRKHAELESVAVYQYKASKDFIDYLSTLESVVEIEIGTLPDEIEVLSGSLDSLRNMKQLESLEINEDTLTEEDLEFVGDLKNLTHFRLIYGELSEKTLNQLLQLEHLSELTCNRIATLSDDTLENLSRSRSLEKIEVWNADRLTETYLALKRIPALKQLTVTMQSKEMNIEELNLAIKVVEECSKSKLTISCQLDFNFSLSFSR